MQLEVVTSHSSTNISMKEVKGVAKRTGLGKLILGKFAYIQTLCVIVCAHVFVMVWA